MSVGLGEGSTMLRLTAGVGKGTLETQKRLMRLSAGKRILSAGDDPSGLSIATKLNAQIRSYQQAVRNANDGLSMVRTADGALDGTTGRLQRLRELAMQAANGALNDEQRGFIQEEMSSIREGLDATASGTEFNGQALLDGSFSGDLQVGDGPSDRLALTFGDASAAALGSGPGSAVADIDLSTAEGARDALAVVDAALAQVSSIRSGLGAYETRISSTINNLQVTGENIVAAQSRIIDADVASETAALAAARVQQDSAVAMQAQGMKLPNALAGLLQ